MVSVKVARAAHIPDPVRISRCQKLPELGPRILFFSGGSALRGLCRVLKGYTHNSIHLVTPFDSGGSSAKLRKAFHMPAIGDLRNRLMSLADESILGNPEIYELFNFRLPDDENNASLIQCLQSIAAGEFPLVDSVQNPMRQLICNQLGYFLDKMPEDFDLRGASIGNLILAGGYFNNHEDLDPIIFLFSKLVNVQGTVRAIVDKDLHLAATLTDGSRVYGQHKLSGKEVKPLSSPIKEIFLTQENDGLPCEPVQLQKKNRKLIENAELICYPPGSFYSSLLANLLPAGVGKAIANNQNPKVFVPNLGSDPEQVDMTLEQLVNALINQLKKDIPDNVANQQLLNFVLIDSKNGQYPSKVSASKLQDLGIELIDTQLVSASSAPYYDNELLVSALLSLA